MKSFKTNFLAVFLFGISLSIFSCSSDDDNPSNLTIQNEIRANVGNGTWKITSFIDSGTDETSDFTGYNFTFNADGVLNATNGVNSFDGTWSVESSNSSDDSPDDLDFNINFTVMNDFEDLSDDWDIISQSSSKIELIDVSGGNGGTDLLTFERN